MNSHKDLPISLEGPEPEYSTDLTDFESFILLCVGITCVVSVAGFLSLVYIAIRWAVS